MFNILVCDDDREIVEAIEIYLAQEGYHVLKAYDGIEALEQMRKNEIHLLIIDVMMPRLDGIRGDAEDPGGEQPADYHPVPPSPRTRTKSWD